jgi:hypothetical protein
MQPRSPARRQSPPPSIPERYKLDHILFTFLSQPTTPKKNEVENKTRYVFSSSRVALPPAVCQFLCLSIFTPRTPDVPKKKTRPLPSRSAAPRHDLSPSAAPPTRPCLHRLLNFKRHTLRLRLRSEQISLATEATPPPHAAPSG